MATARKKASKKSSARKASTQAKKQSAKKSTTSKKKAAKTKKAVTTQAKKKAGKKAVKKTTAKKKTTKKAVASKSSKKGAKRATAKKTTTKKAGTKKSVKQTKRATSKRSRITPLKKRSSVKRRPSKLPSTAAVKKAMKTLSASAYSPSTGTDTPQPFSKKELKKFSELIHAIRDENIQELDELSEQLRAMAANEGGDDNTYSLHMAEQGTDAMEREKTFLQAQRTSDYIKKLDEALIRIQHGAFGICRICGLQLDSRRLMAVPVTQVCTVYKNTSKPCQPGNHFLEIFGEEDE